MRSDHGAAAQTGQAVFSANANGDRLLKHLPNAFVKDFDQTALFLENAQQFTDLFQISEIGFSDDVGSALNKYIRFSLIILAQTALAKHDRILQQTVVKSLLFGQPFEQHSANSEKAHAAEVGVYV